MANIKSLDEIKKMQAGGLLLSRALQAAVDAVRPGITMKALDDIATHILEEGGGKPSFKGYTAGGSIPFPSTVCISNNHEVVHGIGTRDIVLQEGDIVGLDIGVWYEGLCTDMACTVPVGNISAEKKQLLRVTRDAMFAGVETAYAGKTIADISGAIEDAIDQKKYGIVRALVGHGVGHAVHEPPHVPNFRVRSDKTIPLQIGMCLAVEPMITMGGHSVETADDGWTIVTRDGSDAGHFEVTFAITETGPLILTPQPTIPNL